MQSIGATELIVAVVCLSIGIIPFWKIFGKAGFPQWLALLMLVPLLNVILLYYVAFTHWPNRPQ